MLVDILDFFSFVFIMLAAFTVSSKYVKNPNVRLFVFTSYLIACFFLISCAGIGERGWYTWFSLQQIILMLINVRGIRRAIKDIKLDKWNAKCNES